MRYKTPKAAPFVTLCLLLLLQGAGARENLENRAKLLSPNNGHLLFEAVPDQNVTFRLMGDASMLLFNDVDVLAKLKLQRRLAAAQSTVHTAPPLSLDSFREELRAVKRDLNRLTKRLGNLQNGTRRGGPNQRVLRRDLQRVQRATSALSTLETNLAIDECQSNPCKNGATCSDDYKTFHCDCAAGWQGRTCEDDVNECVDLAGTDLAGCVNNGQCINTPGSYRCVCRNGFTGAHCRLRQNTCLASQSTELCGHGTCVASSNAQSYVCICDQGWTWTGNTSVASAVPCNRDLDECAPERNPCYNECINLPGSFRCGACPPGYTGDGKRCRDIDECAVDNGGCSQQPMVACINTEGSYRCGRCPPGWIGDGSSCSEAKSNSCNGDNICHPRAQCEYISEAVVCSCPLGWHGHGYGAEGCALDGNGEAVGEPCERHLCQNNGTCVASGRGTSCVCQPGYTGPLCAEPDACHLQPSPCENGGTCKLLPDNKHKCSCASGYTGASCSNLRHYCGAVLRDQAGSLQFPPTGEGVAGYQPSESCAFIIRTTPGQVLNLTFTAFDLQASADCSADFLQLHDGRSLAARLLGRFCGSALPLGNGSVFSTHEQLFFWFHSDNATQGRGFNITWQSQAHVCGDELDLTQAQSGVIRSPSYPAKARAGLDCRWRLTAPYGWRVLLRFYDVTLGENGGNCDRDNITVVDRDRQLLAVCQSSQPSPLHSSSNQLRLDFHTDAYRADSSFQLHYEVVPGDPGCGGIYTEPRGLISGYMDAAECLYLIEQPSGTQILLEFQRINLLQSEDCDLQMLEIFDGRSSEAPLLRRYCGKPAEMETLTSNGKELLLRYKYKLPGFRLAKGFELSYRRVCGGNYTSPDGGVIETPNYPSGYFEHMTCTFNILGPLNTIVRINITDLSISETTARNADDDDQPIYNEADTNYLDVHLSRDLKRRIYKSSPHMLLMATSNQARLVFHGAANSQRARGMRVEYSFQNETCGGVLGDKSATIFMRIRTDYCQWVIEAPSKVHINILALVLSAEPTTLRLYDNSTGTGSGKLLESLNNENGKYTLDATYDLELITIVWNGPNARGMFTLSYEPLMDNKTCGGYSNSRFGVIKSTNWPRNYGKAQDCVWNIIAPMGHRIELVVRNFTLEDTSDTCTDDYLEIRNGDMALSPLIGRYCGSRIPSRIPSFGNRLFVSFHSDSFIEEAGFYITWQTAATGCGGKLNSHVGSIHSPHSMFFNTGAVSCDWQITVAQGATVAIKLLRPENLCNGQLIIYDGPTTHSRQLPLNCSQPSSELELHSSTNHVLVRYDVDESEPDGVKFVLDYTTNCRVVLQELQGAIESPNFPDKYPPNMNCEWDLRGGGRNNHLQLAFSHFDVEQASPTNCAYDYVELRDMRNEEQLSQRHLCISEAPFTSEGNRLLVRFSSDASAQSQGFRAEFKRLGCGEQLQGQGGRFESPQAPYSVDLDCDWHIAAPAGKQIRLLIQELHIETQRRDCSDDVLTVSASSPGSNSSAASALLRSCQVESSVQTIVSPGNTLHIHFHSSDTRSRKYFKASWVLIPASCGGYVSGSSGVIATPGYHEGSYASGVECVWLLEVPASYGMWLRFEQFNLTDTTNCKTAYVELQKLEEDDSEQFLERACGTEMPMIRQVHGQRLRVRFKADATSLGRFALRFERQCGGTVTAASGYLKSRLDENCRWVVAAPEGLKISLSILSLECEKNSNRTTGLRLLNDDDEVLLYDLCDQHPADIVVPANNVRIEASGINLLAKYATVANSCGGNITSARGTLTSPYYPNSYPSNVECVWNLDVRPGNALELSFEALDIAQSLHCNEDFLEVRAGSGGQLLGLYCDKAVPEAPLLAKANATTDKVWIKFRSISGSTGSGFKLRWNYVHDNELTASNGTVESPPSLAVRNDEQSYNWRIYVERKNVIVLDFEEYSNGLQLFDGFDDSGLTIDISPSTWSFTSSSNVLYLKTTNSDFDTFKLKWRAVSSAEVTNGTIKSSECNKIYTLAYNSRVIVSSPGYPNGYAPNLNCEWGFKLADVTQHAYVDLYAAKLEPLSQCGADYLRIQSSSNLRDWHEELRICNSSEATMTPIRSFHGTPNLQLQFKSDDSYNGTGFKAIVGTACGSNMTGSLGTILDSHILRSRHVNMTCIWHIEVRSGRQIDINIDYASAPLNRSSQGCPHYGLIYDGLDAQAPLLGGGKFCNQAGFATRTYRTSGSHAYIKYVVPTLFGNPLQNLWNLTYREYNACGGEVRLDDLQSSYNISTPGYPFYPHAHSDCSWVVIAPPGETITARFVDRFDVDLRHCDLEFVELFDGSTTLARRLLRTCRRPTATLRSTGNVLLLHYQTDVAEPRGGFRVNVSLSTCGGEFTGMSDTISSEHYPALGAYPRPAVCEYIIKVPLHNRIKLTFSDLHLPWDAAATNSSDRIELVDLQDSARPLLMVLYGNESAPAFTLATNALLLRLVTVKAVSNYRGFQLQYERVFGTCFHELNGVEGTVAITPREHVSGYSICRWRITVPKGQRVRLELLNLADISPVSRNVTSRHPLLRTPPYRIPRPPQFSFYNDPNMQSKITEFSLAGYNGSGIVDSTDNFMVVKILVGQLDLSGITLRGRYSSAESSLCPPDIDDQAMGSLSINPLDNISSFYCTVKFVAKAAETISFLVHEYLIQTTGGASITFMDNQLKTPVRIMYANVSDSPISLSATSGQLTILQNSNIKLKSFRASYRRHSCGGLLPLAEGTSLEQPSLFDSSAISDYGELECVWTLRGNFNDGPYTLSGNVSLSDSCDREYLVVYSGVRAHAVEQARLCRGMAQLNSTQLHRMHTTIVYHAQQHRPGQSQFRLEASKALAGTTILVDAKPTTPITIDAQAYKNNLELSWEFTSTAGRSLVLEFQGRFFIEQAPNCSHDQLQVLSQQAGLWQPEATFCGRELPEKLHVQATRMRLIFRTNGNVTGDGFTFVISSSCDVTVNVTSEPRTLLSPRQRGARGSELSCNYEFLSTEPQQQLLVRVKGVFPNRSGARKCISKFEAYKEKDKAEGGGDELIGEFCESFEVSGYRRLRLRYTTPLERRFEIIYQLHSCGGNYSAPFELRPAQGEGKDSGTYAHDMSCVWRVTAPPEHAIVLRFKYFHMEHSNDCTYDYVAVYKGDVESGEQRVSLLCGNLTATPPTIVVDSEQALIVARSDASNSQRGFLASVRFTPNCNERLALSEGNARMSLARQFKVNASEELLCYFRVKAPPGHRLAIELKQLQLNEGHCATCNYLELLDRFAEDTTSMGKYYGLGRNRTTLLSSYEDVLIKLSGTQAGNLSFELNLQMERTACGETEYRIEGNETISLKASFANESNYGSTHCKWIFKSDEELEIDFKWVQLQDVSLGLGKCVDYLHLKGLFMSKYYCGSFNRSKMVIPKYRSSNFELTFHSSGLEDSEGFELTVARKIFCNCNYTELSGSIQYSYSGTPKGNCTNEIHVPAGYSLTVNIMTIYFENWSDAENNYFNLTDLQTNRVIYNITNSIFDNTIKFTTTNALRIDSHGLSSCSMFYFSTANALPSGCGGEITATEGDLANPPYGNRNHSLCSWLISVPAGGNLRFTFYALDMGSETNCNLDHLTFYEIQPNGREILFTTLCGANVPESFTVRSNRVRIVARKSPNFDGTGFRFVYQLAQDVDMFTQPKQPNEYA